MFSKKAVRVEFRFHTGSIKSFDDACRVPTQKSFDSILVRLKGKEHVEQEARGERSFDSILVRLKA